MWLGTVGWAGRWRLMGAASLPHPKMAHGHGAWSCRVMRTFLSARVLKMQTRLSATHSGFPTAPSSPSGSSTINDQRGLVQGWTLAAPAAIRLRIRGNLKTNVSPQSITFGAQITYSGLKAWDATGKNIPTHFEPTAEGFAVRYDDKGESYPITIDPITQLAYLKPSAVGTTQAGDQFGNSVAVSGDTVVVGAWQEDRSAAGVNGIEDETGLNTGAAYVFVRNGTTWSQQAYLKVSQVTPNDLFDYSMAVLGDTVVVWAINENGSAAGVNGTVNEGALDSGAAHVFVRNGTTWSQQAYLHGGCLS